MERRSLRSLVDAAINKIERPAMSLTTNSSDQWTDKSLSRTLATMREGIEELLDALTLLPELVRFMSVPNLTRIAIWSQREVEQPNSRIEYSVKVVGPALVDEEDRFKLELPRHFSVPETPRLSGMLALLNAEYPSAL
jgi:hypothetical protein